TLAGNSVLFTRKVAEGADPLTAPSEGDSGDITIESPSITINSGSALLAHVQEGSVFHAGNVTLEAKDTSLRQKTGLLPVNVNTLATHISVTGATIRGGEVEINSEAAVEEAYENWGDYSDKLGETIFNLFNQIPGLAISAVTGISGEVIIRSSDASINLDSST